MIVSENSELSSEAMLQLVCNEIEMYRKVRYSDQRMILEVDERCRLEFF